MASASSALKAPTQASDGGKAIAVAGEISARLDRLPTTRTVWKLIFMLSLGFFFELYDLLFSGYVAPGLIRSGILSTTTTGLFGTSGVASFIAALFTGLFIGTSMCGFLADKYGRRTVFTFSLLWYCTANFIMVFQTTAFGLNFWRFVAGIGIGVELVTIGSYLTELAPKHIRGRAFALCQAVGFTAVPVVAFLSYLLVPIDPFGMAGWRWVVLIGCHGALFVWWVRRALPESPRWLEQKGRLEEADRIMTDLERKVEAEYGKPLPPPAPPEPIVPVGKWSEMWVPPYRQRTIMLIAFHIFQTVGYYGFLNWVPTLLIKQGIAVGQSLLYTSLMALAAPLGPLLGLLIADKIERKFMIMGAASVMVVVGSLWLQFTTPVMIIFLGIIMTLAANTLSYSFHAYQQELFPTGIRARAVGFVYSWSRASSIFTTFLIGWTLQHYGVSGVFTLITGAMTIVLVNLGLFGPRTKGRALEDIAH